MTLFSSLLKMSGLSNADAANYFNVSLDTVKSWANGRRNPKPGIFDELHELLRLQENAAGEIFKLWQEKEQPSQIELGYAADNHEAQSLGWPSVGAQMAAYARLWEMLHGECEIILSPRGSTCPTASAADAHDNII